MSEEKSYDMTSEEAYIVAAGECLADKLEDRGDGAYNLWMDGNAEHMWHEEARILRKLMKSIRFGDHHDWMSEEFR